MANVKISALPAVTVPSLTDVLPIVQGGVTKQATVNQLFSNVLQRSTVNVTAAQWKNLIAAPIQLIAAPGAGLMTIVKMFRISMTYSGTVYVGFANTGVFFGTDGTGTTISTGSAPPTMQTRLQQLIQTTASAQYMMVESQLKQLSDLSVASTAVLFINKAVTLANTGTNDTLGTGTFIIDVFYHTVSL